MQNILFSIYCGLTVSICYKLSRGSSNPNVLWNMIKSDVLQMKKVPVDHDDIQDPLPEKLKTILVSSFHDRHTLCTPVALDRLERTLPVRSSPLSPHIYSCLRRSCFHHLY